jgi:hypothetical protein
MATTAKGLGVDEREAGEMLKDLHGSKVLV